MSSNARASGMPSSSAGKEVGDIVQTPDAPIKSWRYLGGGKWEPNDVVRFTETGPGGGNRFLTAGDLAVDAHVALRRGSRHIPGAPLLRAPTNTTGVTSTAGAAVVATTRRGRACYEVTFDAGTGPRNVIIPIPSRVYSDKISVTFEVEDANEWNGGNFRLGLFTASGLTNGMRHQYSIGASNAWNGVRVVAPTEYEWSVVGSGSWASTMTHAAFTGVRRSTPATTEPTRIWIYEITEGERNTLPAIIMGADDGHGTWYSSGLPVLEKYGIPSYMAYIRDAAIAGGSAMTHDQWRDAIARGHYAVVHGCKSGINSLRDYFTSFAPYDSPLAAMIADIGYNRDGMISERLDPDGRGRKIYVLPQGNFQPTGGAGDMTVEQAMLAAGIRTGRRNLFQHGLFANGGWAASRLYLTTIGHKWSSADETANIAALIARMQSEIAAGRSVIFTFHEVRAVPENEQQIAPENLEALCAAAYQLIAAGSARAGRLTDFADELDTYSIPVHVGG